MSTLLYAAGSTDVALIAAGFITLLTFVVPLIGTIVLIWIGVRYFDRRYKGKSDSSKLLSGQFKRTNEVFRDPKDGKLYRVYYNPESGEREYVREE